MKHIDVEDTVHKELSHRKLEGDLRSFNDVVKELLSQANESAKK